MKNPVEHFITFGKDRYHLNGEMENWCEDNFGPGCWLFSRTKTWEGIDNNFWTIDSMFGNTRFSFKDPQHLTMFVLRWS